MTYPIRNEADHPTMPTSTWELGPQAPYLFATLHVTTL